MDKARIRLAFNVVAGLLVAALAVGLYKSKTDAARTEAHVRELQAKIADTQADLRALRADIAHAESPANIEALAEQRLGLVVGEQGAALPETAIEQRLPAPHEAKRE